MARGTCGGSSRTRSRHCSRKPELVKDEPSTAPSMRILTSCPRWQKVFDGPDAIRPLGLDKPCATCPRSAHGSATAIHCVPTSPPCQRMRAPDFLLCPHARHS
ncbi:DUF4276 family protein [Streptomyces sp. NPDC001773]|uniref:DUF4276 family protein n=1 Tax=Streptomyces sp. NPDC005499 TaxID=3154883 RepID=UPI0033B41AD7